MPRIQPVPVETADPEVKEIYDTLKKKMGKVLNIFSIMGNSSNALKGFLALSGAASHSSINPKLQELMALAVAEANQCYYCLSAHTAGAKGVGFAEADIIKARKGEASDPKAEAILRFAKVVAEKRGKIGDADIAALRKAGVSDKEIVDAILVIIVNMFTNYFNNITDPDIDFPKAQPL